MVASFLSTPIRSVVTLKTGEVVVIIAKGTYGFIGQGLSGEVSSIVNDAVWEDVVKVH